MPPPLEDQELAYERAVIALQADPAMREIAEEAFLHDDVDEAFHAFIASEHWARVKALLASYGVAPPGRVMDFGGGRGLMAAALAAEGYSTVLCEINSSDVCGTAAASRLSATTGTQFAIAQRPVAALAGEAPFDAVVCRAVLHHLPDLLAVLGEIRAVLRPGSPFIASDEPTVRREEDVKRLQADNVFVPHGVDEQALTAKSYVRALNEAGFIGARQHFPVSLANYRQFVRPQTFAPLAVAAYAVYRARSALLVRPGDVRSFTARRPSSPP